MNVWSCRKVDAEDTVDDEARYRVRCDARNTEMWRCVSVFGGLIKECCQDSGGCNPGAWRRAPRVVQEGAAPALIEPRSDDWSASCTCGEPGKQSMAPSHLRMSHPLSFHSPARVCCNAAALTSPSCRHPITCPVWVRGQLWVTLCLARCARN